LVYGCDVTRVVCPYAREPARASSEPSFALRPVLAGNDARSLALDMLCMSQPELAAGFRDSLMWRANLRESKHRLLTSAGRWQMCVPDGRTTPRSGSPLAGAWGERGVQVNEPPRSVGLAAEHERAARGHLVTTPWPTARSGRARGATTA
jgi:hypothetical protein